jgi:putative DNA primase/helicase
VSIDIKALIATVDLAAVVLARMPLASRGNEWVGLCPFHAESTGSFTVYRSKKTGGDRYKCHGCGAAGDALDVVMNFDGLTIAQAAEELGRPLEDASPVPAKPRPPVPPDWISYKPPADESLSLQKLTTRDLGEPTRYFEIRDELGDLLGYVARYPHPEVEGKKVVLTWSWGHFSNKTVCHWEKKHFTRPRPLYGLDRLAKARIKRDKPQVILLEGEGKADSAGALFPGSVGMSWLGGAEGVTGNDYTPIKGLEVVLIPDNDDPGRKAVSWLREHLIGMGCDVTVLAPEPEREKGWNLDDAEREGWTQQQAMAWARERKLATQQKAADVPQEAPERPAPGSRPRLYAVDGNAAIDEDPRDIEAELSAEFSEMNLAAKFIEAYGEDWHYVARLDRWIEWRKDGWYVDDIQRVKTLCMRVVRQAAASDPAGRLTQPVLRALCSSKVVNGIKQLVSIDETIAATVGEWDLDPYLLGVPGGTVDLREGKLMSAERDDKITKRCAVAPDPGEPTRWLAHLHKALSGQQDVIDFIRRYCGSMLTGDAKEHCLLFFYGQGRNGKGTIIETVVQLMGDYGYAAPTNLIMEGKTERHPAELAMLQGKRAVSCSEPPQGARWDDGRIRWLTGGDTITARDIGEKFTSFIPTHHLIIMGNHKPKLRSVDDATTARFHMVNFSVNMTLEADFDKDLPHKLKAEWPRILNWMIQGCLEWQRVGLAPPKAVKDATKEYLEAEHVIEQWLADCCTRGGTDPVSEIYRSYTTWCEQVGEHPKSRRSFTDELYAIPGIEAGRSSVARMVKGITLKRTPGQDYQDPLY